MLFIALTLLTIVAVTSAINDPQQIRLAIVPPNGICVSWSTLTALPSAPRVLFGLNQFNLNNSATGESSSYGTRYFHNVILNNLVPFQEYYYEIADNDNPSIHSFNSPRPSGDPNPFKLFIVGDMGLINSNNTIQSLNEDINDAEFIVHIGDISYADAYVERHDSYEGAWDEYQTKLESITQAKPYMVLPGNHEVTCNEDTPDICPQGQRNFTAYKARFRMPGPESGGVGNLWFSYDYGMAHFVHLNFETDFPNAPSTDSLGGGGEIENQIEWLENDLIKANSNRVSVPWIIALSHRPYYSSGGICDSCATTFEPLFNKYGVDIHFSGHVHWYERLYAISPGGVIENRNYSNPSAPVYIVNGAAGNIEGHSAGDQMEYSALIDKSDYGYGSLSFDSYEQATWSFYRATDKSLVDQIQITKTRLFRDQNNYPIKTH